jgi:hypothetical protein
MVFATGGISHSIVLLRSCGHPIALSSFDWFELAAVAPGAPSSKRPSRQVFDLQFQISNFRLAIGYCLLAIPPPAKNRKLV